MRDWILYIAFTSEKDVEDVSNIFEKMSEISFQIPFSLILVTNVSFKIVS